MLTTITWIYGIAQLAAGFLAIIAGFIAISLLGKAHQVKLYKAWRFLLIALILFTVEEILGGLKAFGIYSTPHLTHVVPSFILAFLIAALAVQININRGWIE